MQRGAASGDADTDHQAVAAAAAAAAAADDDEEHEDEDEDEDEGDEHMMEEDRRRRDEARARGAVVPWRFSGKGNRGPRFVWTAAADHQLTLAIMRTFIILGDTGGGG